MIIFLLSIQMLVKTIFPVLIYTANELIAFMAIVPLYPYPLSILNLKNLKNKLM